MVNRRGFIGLLLTGIVACKLPTTWFPSGIRSQEATKFLSKAWFDYFKIMKKMPTEMYASSDLFDAFEGEIVAAQRFTSNTPEDDGLTTLRFKSTKLIRLSKPEKGWRVHIP